MAIEEGRGRSVQIPNDVNVLEIIQVTVFQNQSSIGKRLFTGQFTFSNNKVTVKTKKPQFKIKVEYEKSVSREEFQQSVPPELFNAVTNIEAQIKPQMLATAENVKAERSLLEGAPINNMGESLAGIKSLFAGGKPIKAFRKKAAPSVLEENAGEGIGVVTNALANETKTLFGDTGIQPKAFLKSVVADGSAKAQLRTFQKNLNLKPEKARQILTKFKPATDKLSASTGNILEKAMQNFQSGKSPQKQITTQTQKTIKEKTSEIFNQGDPLSSDIFGKISKAAGRSGTNIQAALAAVKTKGVKPINPLNGLPDISGDIKNKFSALAPGAIVPKGFKEPPNFIEGLDFKTGKPNFDTNLSKLIGKSELTADAITPSFIKDLQQHAGGFTGLTTPSDYAFEVIDGFNELKTDFETSQRGKEDTKRSIRTLVIGWTAKVWGGPKEVNARRLHELSIEAQKNALVKEFQSQGNSASDAVKKADTKMKNKPFDFGLQAHYVILTNGSIQRGRPIDLTRSETMFDLDGVQLTIVASEKHPVNADQQRALENFTKLFYESFEGANVFGDYEYDLRYLGPGIDVEALREKFSKVNNVEDPTKITSSPTKKEAAFIKPKKLAKPAETAFNSKRKFSFDKVAQDFDKINQVDGTKIQKDLDAAIGEMNTGLDKISSDDFDLQAEIEKAKNAQNGSIGKFNSDNIIKNKTAAIDKAAGAFNRNIKDVAGNNKIANTIANKLGFLR